MNKTIALLGAGGMSREIINWAEQSGYSIDHLYDGTIPEYTTTFHNANFYTIKNKIDLECYYTAAVGYPKTKYKIMKNLNNKIKLAGPVIHPSCAEGNDIKIGDGSIICPYVVLTSDIIIGELSSINTLVTIGHNVRIGEMFHASPNSSVSGDVLIGNRVFLGTGACIKEKITICKDVIIGAGAVVITHITESGIYAGSPAKKIKDIDYE